MGSPKRTHQKTQPSLTSLFQQKPQAAGALDPNSSKAKAALCTRLCAGAAGEGGPGTEHCRQEL